MAKIRLLHFVLQPIFVEEVGEYETKPGPETQPLAVSIEEARKWLDAMPEHLVKINEQHEAKLAAQQEAAAENVEDGDEDALPCDV